MHITLNQILKAPNTQKQKWEEQKTDKKQTDHGKIYIVYIIHIVYGIASTNTYNFPICLDCVNWYSVYAFSFLKFTLLGNVKITTYRISISFKWTLAHIHIPNDRDKKWNGFYFIFLYFAFLYCLTNLWSMLVEKCTFLFGFCF